MLVTPTNFPSHNNHRIALFQPDIARTDFDRIEDIGADAIAAARCALGQLEHLPHGILKPIDGFIRTIRTGVDQRRVLTEDFRHAALLVLKHLVREDRGEDIGGDFDQSIRQLARALDLSHRVQDLLAAEKDIGHHRGFRG